MRYLRQAGSDPAFLLKALSEASGELRQTFYGVRRRQLLVPGDPPDEDWCLLALAVHMRDVELGVYRQLETIIHGGREPAIRHVDVDDIPLPEDYRHEEADEVIDEFHYYRKQTAYLLWDLSERAWERSGIHPYRGPVTILELTRELYQHDLEHLWQARRLVASLAQGSR